MKKLFLFIIIHVQYFKGCIKINFHWLFLMDLKVLSSRFAGADPPLNTSMLVTFVGDGSCMLQLRDVTNITLSPISTLFLEAHDLE